MNVHEYQAKDLLAKRGLPVPAGYPAMNPDEAAAAAGKLPGPLYVVKAQIHAGGRGKGKFMELGPDAKGGVRLARTAQGGGAGAGAGWRAGQRGCARRLPTCSATPWSRSRPGRPASRSTGSTSPTGSTSQR